jgi:hypothetical protein
MIDDNVIAVAFLFGSRSITVHSNIKHTVTFYVRGFLTVFPFHSVSSIAQNCVCKCSHILALQEGSPVKCKPK